MALKQYLMSIKWLGNNFGQESLTLFYELFNEEKKNYPDLVVYHVDNNYEMAYLETKLEHDIYCK